MFIPGTVSPHLDDTDIVGKTFQRLRVGWAIVVHQHLSKLGRNLRSGLLQRGVVGVRMKREWGLQTVGGRALGTFQIGQ